MGAVLTLGGRTEEQLEAGVARKHSLWLTHIVPQHLEHWSHLRRFANAILKTRWKVFVFSVSWETTENETKSQASPSQQQLTDLDSAVCRQVRLEGVPVPLVFPWTGTLAPTSNLLLCLGWVLTAPLCCWDLWWRHSLSFLPRERSGNTWWYYPRHLGQEVRLPTINLLVPGS